jgi:hypothetical protein
VALNVVAEGGSSVKRRSHVPGTRAGRMLFVLPEIPEDASEAFKNSLAIRNVCATEGKCPSCGAIGELYADKRSRGLFHIVFRHEDECPVLRDQDAA